MSPRVIFLGTGDAACAGGRHQASYLIQGLEGSFLLDCSPTTLASLKRHGLSSKQIDMVLLSHFHGDHFAGLPFLLLEYRDIELRSRPLPIVGPPGVQDRVMMIFRAMYPDAASEPLPYALDFIEAHPHKQLSVGGVLVDPFPAPHQKQPISLGYLITVDNRKILYSGDTGWNEELVAFSQGTDLFICECTLFETTMATHLNYPLIAENLSRFGSKRMILTHLGHEALRRQEEIKLEIAHDGLVVDL